MAKEVIMPKFGFTMEESEILEWKVKDGDAVEQGDPLAVVSTDKISMEVEAPETGVISGIRYQVGEIVPVTEIIAYILKPGEKLPPEANAPKRTVKPAEEAPAAPAPAPAPAASVPTVTPVPAAAAELTPVAARMVREKGLDAAQIPGSGPGGRITRQDVESFVAETAAIGGRPRATPAARRAARELGVDLAGLRGSGPSGRLQEADVRAAAQAMPARMAVPAGEVRTIPFTGMRRTIALNMQRSWQAMPTITLSVDVDMSAALALHEQAKTQAGPEKKVSLTAVLVKAAAYALARNPIVNSVLGEDVITLLPEINVGVAVALEGGLIVPVVHRADQQGVLSLAEAVNDVISRARENRLRQADLEGGTFTISNLGMYGIDRFTAIINPPQVAILAVGQVRKVFVPDENDQPVLRPLTTFTICCDHRVVDGVDAARFLADLRQALEKPEVMLL